MSQKLSYASQAIFWTIAGSILLGVLILFKEILLPFAVGATIAYLLNPVVNLLGRKGLKRWVASLVILGAFFIIVSTAIAVVAPLLVREVSEFIDHVPEYARNLTSVVQSRLSVIEQKTGVDLVNRIHDGLQDDIGKALQMSQKLVGGVAAGIFMGGSAIVGFITTMLLIPIAAYFMMKDWPRIVIFMHGMVPKAHRAAIHDIFERIDIKISGFIRGQLLVCLILGVTYAVALSVAGLQYGALIGLMTGLLSVIPYVGSTLGLLASVGVAALQSGGEFHYISIIAVIFFAGQFVEGNFITPKLIGDSVGLHPLWIIFALLAGGSLLGLLGMLIAVPAAAVISVLLAFAIRKYKSSAYFKTPEVEIEVAQTVLITQI